MIISYSSFVIRYSLFVARRWGDGGDQEDKGDKLLPACPERSTCRREALTWRIYHKNNRWYIAVTVNVTVVPNQSKPVQYGCIGVDLNPGVVGWCYTDSNGNPVEKGQFKVNLHSRRSGQVKAELADVVVKLVELSEKYACPIVIERLDFSGKKKQMREQGRRYSRMLNAFAYGTFKDVLQDRCWSRGVQLIKVNPAYSSLIGLTKFMRIYGMSSDTAAGLVGSSANMG